jgi:hypothetical protein
LAAAALRRSSNCPASTPDTESLLDEAHWTAHDIDAYHYFDGEESTLRLHCWGHAVYDKLQDRYWAARSSGNELAAAVIDSELGHLGEELAYDEYLADYWGGYP